MINFKRDLIYFKFMQKEYDDSSKEIRKFKEKIFFYCDSCEVNSEVLFPVFMELWPESDKLSISRKDLASLTSNILNELIDKGVLCINGKKSDNVYAFYKILPHKDLINYEGFINKKKSHKFMVY